MNRDKKTGRLTPKLSDKEFNHLVDMVKNETDIIRIYEFLDEKFDDNRTKWVNLKKALFQANDAH